MRMRILLAAMLVCVLAAPATAHAETCVYFFYGNGCSHCAAVEPFMDGLESEGIEVHRFEVYNNRSNTILLNEYFASYDVPQNQRGVPAAFITGRYIIGDKAIESNLRQEIENSPGGCPELDGANTSGISGESSPAESLSDLSMLTIIGAALVDSINPCAIAVLLILLSALIASNDRKRALKAGLAFITSIYIAYFLFGLGLFSVLQVSGISYWFYRFIGILAIAIGLFNLKDYFHYGGGGFVMEIPRRWRPRLKKMLSAVVSVPGAFLLGFLVCLFELPCTGGPYLFILGLLAEKTTLMASIPILLIYNIFFVLPLIVLTLMVYMGRTSIDSASDWKERNIRKLHLVAGIVMVALGLLVLLGLV